MRFFVLIPVFLLATQARAADDSCAASVQNINKAIQQADAPASSGQLTRCIPVLGDPARASVASLQARNADSAKKFDLAYQEYAAVRQKTDQIQKDLESGGGNICGATPEVQADVKKVAQDLAKAQSDFAKQLDSFTFGVRADYQFFFLAPRGAITGGKIFAPRTCQQTGQNLKAIGQLYDKAIVICSDAYNGIATTRQNVDQLNGFLKSGCAR